MDNDHSSVLFTGLTCAGLSMFIPTQLVSTGGVGCMDSYYSGRMYLKQQVWPVRGKVCLGTSYGIFKRRVGPVILSRLYYLDSYPVLHRNYRRLQCEQHGENVAVDWVRRLLLTLSDRSSVTIATSE